MRLLIVTIILFKTIPVICQNDKLPVTDIQRKSIYFGGGSYVISEEQIESIKQFIASVENPEFYQIAVAGHTDTIGSREYNEWLSQMRCKSVIKELSKLNIDEKSIHINSFGEENPLYNNNEFSSRQLNRRVDIILTPIVY